MKYPWAWVAYNRQNAERDDSNLQIIILGQGQSRLIPGYFLQVGGGWGSVSYNNLGT